VDELEEKPESLRMRKLKELIEQMSMLMDAPEESAEPAPAMPEAMPEEKPSF
jgi:hypothetical protein